MIKITDKEKRIISITLASFGVFMIGSGLIMNNQIKPIIRTQYTLKVSTKKIPETQAKKKEIKVKNFEIEINTPISVNIKDYLEDADTIDESTLKKLKLDTSLVNINQVGTYQYTITYGKKKYIGNINIKEKEIKPPPFTVKEKITIPKGGTLDINNKSLYLNNTPPADVLANIIIDISAVDLGKIGSYQFSVTYLDTKYTGIIEVVADSFSTPKECPPNTKETADKTSCTCVNEKLVFNNETWKCEEPTT